ncbi:simple sugar transport system permease protein [Kaistia hirudinis]|uniref:Simple sugar transport system permease protein n=1 Tax=Kaistia hirudinis TaxID=1293440 RepID=A0A840AJL7_9HYPH|nr:ABC transporter permease [Kaistia hirudinis]MBB3929334.1 simple sugar transport system permease protein [Kaistia hirudinis]
MDPIAFVTDPVMQGFLQATTRLAIPIMLAALGGMFAERAGVLNIALEGMMLAGAFTGFATAYASGSLWLGVALGMSAGAVIGLVLAFYTVKLTSNQVVVGIAINLMMIGATSYAFRAIFGPGTDAPRVTPFPPVNIPILADIPILGPLFFQQGVLVYAAFVLIPLSWIVMSRMSAGMAITAVGEHPEAAETLGISVARVRTLCLVASGLIAGLGGAFLSLSATGLFLDNMTAGRGYIALAILLLGRRNPWGIAAAAALFGGADAFQLRGQGFGSGIPYQFLVMLPYILTIVVLIGFAGKGRDPAALGRPFQRNRAE